MIDGLFSAAFGFVVLIQEPNLYFGTSLILRIIQSLGERDGRRLRRFFSLSNE